MNMWIYLSANGKLPTGGPVILQPSTFKLKPSRCNRRPPMGFSPAPPRHERAGERRLRFRRSEQGSALLITLVMGLLFGMLLMYFYLPLVNNQRISVVRSQAWNASLALAEAGAEEALAQMNPGAAPTGVDLTANGWGPPSSAGFYGPVSRSLTDGSYQVAYSSTLPPTIYATGYVSVPFLSATLTRAISVTTSNLPLYSAALVGINSIQLNGSGVETDSFNSANTNLSTNGQYDPAKASTNGSVASVNGPVNLGNHTISGTLDLGPTAPFTSTTGQVSGGILTNFNPTFDDVVYPAHVSFVPPAAPLVAFNYTTNGAAYNYAFLASGDYQISSLNGTTYVAPGANVRLQITTSSSPTLILVDGTGTGPTAGHLTIYMAGTSFNLAGGTFANGGNALNLTYYGMPSNTSIKFNGNAAFIGTVYAPEANVTITGGGSSAFNFVGALIANSVVMNGHFLFHFDEDLLTAGPSRGFVATSWQEL